MTTKPKAENLIEEEKKMNVEIEKLEAEERETNSPARGLTWAEIEAGAAEDLEKRERRRGILPRLITAARVRRLEVRRERYEAEMEPFLKKREEAYERRQAATAKRLEAVEEENAARADYGDANARVMSREQRIKEANREIRALRGEG
ncbi:MAG: hypothetical protein M3R38_25840 [Actinomycetota bacterium]|nr:hypothetical protein [Actinomycetota bacterium]